MASAVTELRQWILSVIGPAAGDPRTAQSVRTPLGQLASRTKWLKEGLYNVIYGQEQLVTNADAASDLLTVAAHGLNPNTAVRVYAVDGGALPTGLSANTVYYVAVDSADEIGLSLTSGPGALVNITTNLTGSVYIEPLSSWAATMLIVDATYGTGALRDLVMWLGGAQTVTGAKTFANLTMSGLNRLGYTSRSLDRTCQSGPWVKSAGAAYTGLVNLVGGASDQAEVLLDLPHDQVLQIVKVSMEPIAVGALPGTMPSAAAFFVPKTGGGEQALGAPVSDSSASVGAYNAVHDIEITGISHTVDRTANVYFLRVQGSSGSSGANDVTACAPRAVCTVTSQREWI